MIGELEIGKVGEDEDNDTIAFLDETRVAKELHLETYNTDPGLLDIWRSLFGVEPGNSTDDRIFLIENKRIVWESGILEMGGTMKIEVKADKLEPGLKEIKIKEAGKKEGITTFISEYGWCKSEYS